MRHNLTVSTDEKSSITTRSFPTSPLFINHHRAPVRPSLPFRIVRQYTKRMSDTSCRSHNAAPLRTLPPNREQRGRIRQMDAIEQNRAALLLSGKSICRSIALPVDRSVGARNTELRITRIARFFFHAANGNQCIAARPRRGGHRRLLGTGHSARHSAGAARAMLHLRQFDRYHSMR